MLQDKEVRDALMLVESEMETLIHCSRIITRQCVENCLFSLILLPSLSFSPLYVYSILAKPYVLRELFPIVCPHTFSAQLMFLSFHWISLHRIHLHLLIRHSSK